MLPSATGLRWRAVALAGLAAALLAWWPLSASAYFESARLNYRGASYYEREFAVSGSFDLGSTYAIRSHTHLLTPSQPVVSGGLSLGWRGLRLSQTLVLLENEYEYMPSLEYNGRWGNWDFGLRASGRIHLEGLLDNFIEYGLAGGVRLNDRNRLALMFTRIEDDYPHHAVEALYELHIKGVFHFQNVLGLEQVFNGIVHRVGEVSPLPGLENDRKWQPYFHSMLLLEFTRGESWKPSFEFGFRIRKRAFADEVILLLVSGIRLGF